MSAPNPIFVSPSTTFVQVDPLQSPYNPVILNSVVYPGQVVSVRDATSSFGVLTTPIVVSTAINTTFLDFSISTLINQPQGFLTAQTYSTNTWAFLNSFPFRNQFVSAAVLNLNTSTLFTAVASTTQEYVNQLLVENLFVTGNFVQSQGITLNTNVSSFGTVEFTSSLSVWGHVFLSSGMTVQGAVELYSSLQVSQNFLSKSTLTTVSSFTVSSFVSVIGSLSTPVIQLQDGLVGPRIEVQTSSLNANLGGSLSITSNLSTLGSFNGGGFVQGGTLVGRQDFQVGSSVSLYQTANVSSFTSTLFDVSVAGSLGVGGRLAVGGDLFVQDSLVVKETAYIRDLLTIQSTLTTSTLITTVLETFGDYANKSTIAQISSVFVDTNLGASEIQVMSTLIAGDLTVSSNLNLRGNLSVNQDLEILQSFSSLGTISVGNDMRVEGGFSTLQTLFVSSLLSTTGTLRVTNTMLLDTTTTIGSNVQGLGNLVCDGTLTISSITLPSSLIANNFTTGTLFVGTYALTKDSDVSVVKTSSMTVGYIPNTSYSFDLSGSLLFSEFLIPTSLSTTLFSTQLFSVGLNTKNTFLVPNAMGVGVEPGTSSFLVNPLGYFLSSPIYVFSTLSTNVVYANTLLGEFQGDGALLSNIQYPSALSSFEIFVTENVTVAYEGQITTTTLLLSTFTNQGSLNARSTLTIGSLEIRGNTDAIEYNRPTNTIQTSPVYDLLTLNGMNIFGSGPKRVVLNENYISNVTAAQYAPLANLAVYNSLAVTSLPPTNRLIVHQYRGNKVIANEALGFISPPGPFLPTPSIPTDVGNLTVLSGVISSTTGKFFVGEGDPYDGRFNSVQPYQSTLQFNSTLFVNRKESSVGINTKPNFSLDVESIGVEYTTSITETVGSMIKGSIQLTSLPSTLYYAFLSTTTIPLTYSNTVYSETLVSWKNMTSVYTPGNTYIYNSYFTNGLSRTSTLVESKTVFPENQLEQIFLGKEILTSGQEFGLITRLGSYSFVFTTPSFVNLLSPPPDTFRSMNTDGYTYIAVGTNTPSNQVISSNTLFSSTDLNSFNAIPLDINGSNIFPPWDSPTSYTCGGYSITYGGPSAPFWVAVGVSKNGPLYTSPDGSTWTPNDIGSYELRSVITTPLPNNGGTVFLAGGAALSPLGTTFLPVGGYVFSALNPTGTWTDIGTDFTGPVNAIATDGQKVVVAVDANAALHTLWYSYLRSDNRYVWTLCDGDVLGKGGTSVIWNGSLWVAGGVEGIRHSLNGITWYNPGGISTPVVNVAYMSNATTSLQTGLVEQSNLLYFQDSPFLQSQRLLSVATVSYYPSSILNLNNALLFDWNQNIVVPGAVNTVSPLSGTNFRSTFYAGSSYISSTLSTNKIVVGSYNISVQTV
jgi:predicted acyltransferase (DUF342 family)